MLAFLTSSRFKLYCSHALSATGDRMWMFAVSLVMVQISHDLRLTAISMVLNGVAVLMFAAAVGRWVDVTPRLRAAIISLAANNICVAASAALLVVLLQFDAQLDEWTHDALIVLTMIFAAVSLLANIASGIIVKKDWVVEIAKGDSAALAQMNSRLVAISQTALILAPIIVGQIMTSINLVGGCLFIAGWNVCSFALELFLLYLVYRSVPELAVKNKPKPDKAGPVITPEGSPNETRRFIQPVEPTAVNEKETSINGTSLQVISEVAVVNDDPEKQRKIPGEANGSSDSNSSSCVRIVLRRPRNFVHNMWHGWTIYRHHPIFPAAFALALLYMTVLGFDGITRGYAYEQGLEENLLAVVQGAGAIFGISATFAFPLISKRIGLQRTGLISLSLQLSCLTFCVGSVFLPGSPFDPVGYFLPSEKPRSAPGPKLGLSGKRQIAQSGNLSSSNISDTSIVPVDQENASMCSLWALLTGIVLSRFGLWLADLTITQIMQMGIAQNERGLINGVQSALQQSMDMLKSILCIILPKPETFGLLIFVSAVMIASANVSFAVYSRRIRGHLFHFEKLRNCLCVNDNVNGGNDRTIDPRSDVDSERKVLEEKDKRVEVTRL